MTWFLIGYSVGFVSALGVLGVALIVYRPLPPVPPTGDDLAPHRRRPF